MFRSRLTSMKTVVAKGKKFFSSDAGAVTTYPGAVQFFHWTMGGALVAAVGKCL